MGKYNVRVVVVKFFFCGKKNAKRQHWFIFWAKYLLFSKTSRKISPFFLGEIVAQVFILATLFNGPVQNHRQLYANLFGETLHCCYTTKLGKQSTGVVCIFPPVLMTHVNLVGYLSILALCRMTVSLPHLIAL